MFKFKNLFSVSLSFFPMLKYFESSGKFNRILCNSGCLIAGCCFSKKSDEEAHIYEGIDKSNYESFSKNIEKENVNCSSKFETDDSGSNAMKRSFESINNISQNVASDLSVQESGCKKKKTDSSETENNKHIQIKQPVYAAADAITESAIVEKDKFKTGVRNPKNLRPNYFVAIKISDDHIHQELKELQSHILQKDDRIKKSLIELKTLHITLMVMHIGDPETHARAVETLTNIHREHDEDMSKNPMLLKFQGLSHFKNRVLYAKLIEDDSHKRLLNLVQSVRRRYSSASIFSTDSRQDFTPHLTVAKIDFKNKLIKKINPLFYKDFENQYFGTQKVESIQLLSMLDKKTADGYYSGEEIYFSAFEPSVRRESLTKLLEIEEKKKDVKEMINAAIKKNFK